MALYNDKGIFSNTHDDLDGLRAMLAEHFDAVTVDVAGCAALFSGRSSKSPDSAGSSGDCLSEWAC